MILLKNITLNGRRTDILTDGPSIAKIVPAGTIEAVLREPENAALALRYAAGAETMDCSGKVAIPGFINMHTHAAMTLMRGIIEDDPLHDWLSRIWDMEKKIDSDFVYWGTKVACLEMIKSGTTCFNDQYFFPDAARQAAVDIGIRPVISSLVLDHGRKEEAARQKEQCIRMYEESLSRKDGSMLAIAFHAVYSVTEEMMVWTTEFAKSHGLKLHIHLAETQHEDNICKAAHKGLSPTEYLDELGILGPHLIAAHTLWLSDHDIELLGSHRVNCVHNINSNAKLSSGYKFPYNELRDAGANVCLGTDGAASSNNLDMLETMKTTALFQKAWRMDPAQMPLPELMAMATVNGARALGIHAGVLEEGALADISVVDTETSCFLSPGSFEANLVYSAHSDCIDSVIAGGRFVMKNREVANEKSILRDARKVLSQIA